MRCASCRNSGLSSRSRSSGWPIRMICSSLAVAVSRFVSSRTCSSVCVLRFCASSTISTTRRPRACVSSRWRPSRSISDLGAAAARLGNRHVQFLADREQELGRRDAGVQDQRDVRVARQLLEQAADHGGLAGADLARELDETARLVDAVQQVRERLGMPLAEVQVAGVRRDRERLFLETEKARVHAELDGSEAQGWAANDACPDVAWLAAPAYPVRLAANLRHQALGVSQMMPFRLLLLLLAVMPAGGRRRCRAAVAAPAAADRRQVRGDRARGSTAAGT